MAAIREPKPAKLICGVMCAPNVDRDEINARLVRAFGDMDMRGPVFNVSDFTSYYQDEMGVALTKQFVSFERLYHPSVLSRSKLVTNGIEEATSESGKRSVNLDPGYVTAAKLVLATTKDFAHRIFVADGIYGDVQFRFRQGRFEPGKWTYPDYQAEFASRFFNQVRKRYMEQERLHEKVHQL